MTNVHTRLHQRSLTRGDATTSYGSLNQSKSTQNLCTVSVSASLMKPTGNIRPKILEKRVTKAEFPAQHSNKRYLHDKVVKEVNACISASELSARSRDSYTIEDLLFILSQCKYLPRLASVSQHDLAMLSLLWTTIAGHSQVISYDTVLQVLLQI